jgi:hypothetical protein
MREATNKILEMVEEGVLDRDTVIMAALKYMSEDDVADMAHANEFFDEEDYDDGQPTMYEEYQDLYGGDDAFETCNFMEDY